MYKYNLQLFADNDNMTKTTNEDLSPEMKEFYNNALLEYMGPKLYHAQFCEETDIPANNGTTAEWREFEDLPPVTEPLTEGVTPKASKIKVKNIKATTKQYGDYSILTDLVQLTAIDKVLVQATKKHAKNAALSIDKITRNEFVKGTQVMYVPIEITGGTKLTVNHRYELDQTALFTAEMAKRAATILKKSNTETFDDDCFRGIIHPSISEDLTNSKGWIDAHIYASPEEIYAGEIGKLHGIRFVETTEAKIFCGANLASDARNLTVNGAISEATSTVTFDGGTVKASELVGRLILINDKQYLVSANDTTTLTLADPITEEAVTINNVADNTPIYPGEGGKDGKAVYATLIFGKGAMGKVKLKGGLEMIVKPLGSGGTADPLNQRGTTGWKHIGYAAKMLHNPYCVRVESGSTYSNVDTEN